LLVSASLLASSNILFATDSAFLILPSAIYLRIKYPNNKVIIGAIIAIIFPIVYSPPKKYENSKNGRYSLIKIKNYLIHPAIIL
jgi:hypothetical protein